jgi:colanic acid biosynthesis protein WcaH
MNRSGKLNMEEYVQACTLTQIVSVDLLIKDKEGKYLFGLRRNPPAKNTYFVPGCRAFKGEELINALIRTMKEEIGCELNDIEFYGVYEHMYKNDNPGDTPGVDTHYVVIVFKGNIPDSFDQDQFQKQHSDAKWMTPKEILDSEEVHKFSQYYFSEHPPNCVVRLA